MFIMDELLIEKVRKHEALYNPNCRDYRDKYVRQESWEVIGRELQISGRLVNYYLLIIYFDLTLKF